jgi:hypothetical protein
MDVLKRNREAIGKESSAGTGNSNTSSSTGSVLTSGNIAFDSMFNQGFKDLITNYKNRNNKEVRKRNETTTWSDGNTQTLSSSSATEKNGLIASPPISKGNACATSTSQFSSSNLDQSPKETSSPEKSPMGASTISLVASLSTEANSSVTTGTSVNDYLRKTLVRPPACMSSRKLTENSRLSNGVKLPATKSVSPFAPGEKPRLSRPSTRLTPQKKVKRWCCSACTFINTHPAWPNTKSRCNMCDSEWEEKMDIIPQSNGTSKSSYIEIDS